MTDSSPDHKNSVFNPSLYLNVHLSLFSKDETQQSSSWKWGKPQGLARNITSDSPKRVCASWWDWEKKKKRRAAVTVRQEQAVICGRPFGALGEDAAWVEWSSWAQKHPVVCRTAERWSVCVCEQSTKVRQRRATVGWLTRNDVLHHTAASDQKKKKKKRQDDSPQASERIWAASNLMFTGMYF